MVGSAVGISAGKSSWPIWLLNAAPTVSGSILIPSGEVPLLEQGALELEVVAASSRGRGRLTNTRVSWFSSMSLDIHAQSSSSRCTGTLFALRVARQEGGLVHPERWVTPRSDRLVELDHACRSITLPSQSMLMPYSNSVPGSATSGAVKLSFRPESTFETSVAASHLTMSAFQNQ